MGPGGGWAGGFPCLMSSLDPQDLCYHLLYDWPPGHHLLGRVPLWNHWKPHALRSSLSISSYEPWQRWGRLPVLHPLRSVQIIVSPCYLSSPICDTRKEVMAPWLFLFVQVSGSWLNSFLKSNPKYLEVECIFLSGKGWSLLRFLSLWSQFCLVGGVGLRCPRLTVAMYFYFFNLGHLFTQFVLGGAAELASVSSPNLGLVMNFLQLRSLLPGAQLVSQWSLGSL